MLRAMSDAGLTRRGFLRLAGAGAAIGSLVSAAGVAFADPQSANAEWIANHVETRLIGADGQPVAGLPMWTRMRIVRGLALDAKSRDYIQAAQTRGEHPLWIMLVELLPNVRGPIIVDACLRLGYTTVAITTLTFLGLGLQPPDPDWGLMIKESATAALLWKYSYMLIVPALSVSSLILGFNLIADGLREMSLRD